RSGPQIWLWVISRHFAIREPCLLPKADARSAQQIRDRTKRKISPLRANRRRLRGWRRVIFLLKDVLISAVTYGPPVVSLDSIALLKFFAQRTPFAKFAMPSRS